MNLENLKLYQHQAFLSRYEDGMEEKELVDLVQECYFDNKDNHEKKPYKQALKECGAVMTYVNEPRELTLAFLMDDIEFGFIPDLEGCTFGEIMDLDTYIPHPEQHHRLMAVLYRPIVEHKNGKYRINTYQGTDGFCDVMEDMPLHIYISALSFFGSLGLALQTAFPSYLQEEKDLTVASLYLQKKLLALSGAGIKP